MTTDLRAPANDFEDDGIFVGNEAEMVTREDAALERGDHTTALTSTMTRVSTKALEVLIGAGVVTQKEIDAWADADDTGGWGEMVVHLLDRVEEPQTTRESSALAIDAAVRVLATSEDVRQTLLDLVELMSQIDAGRNDVTIDPDIFAEVAFWGAALGSASERLNAVLSGVYNAPEELNFTRERLRTNAEATNRKRADKVQRWTEYIRVTATGELAVGAEKTWSPQLMATRVLSVWNLTNEWSDPEPSHHTVTKIIGELIKGGKLILPGRSGPQTPN